MREDPRSRRSARWVHISFRPLSLLTIPANTSTDWEHCFPQSWHHHPPIIYASTNTRRTSQAMPFHQTKHNPSHIGAVCQAAQNKRRGAISRLLWMPSTSPVEKGFYVGISRPVRCSRVQCACGGGFYIIFSISTSSYNTWIMRGIWRNPTKWNAE